VTNTPSISCFAELGSFPHWIESTAGVRVDDFNTVVGGISRRRRVAARGRVRRIERGRAEGEEVAFLGLGGVGEMPETRWSRPPVTAACWPTVGAPSGRKMEWEVLKSGKGGRPLFTHRPKVLAGR